MWADGKAYDPAEVDFIVIYIPPEDAWYVVPAADVHVRMLPLRPHRFRGRYEKYRDAWRLLTGDPEDDNRTLGFTIYAAAEQTHR
jgi:PD-(D/E)XK nuclease superfamily protein